MKLFVARILYKVLNGPLKPQFTALMARDVLKSILATDGIFGDIAKNVKETGCLCGKCNTSKEKKKTSKKKSAPKNPSKKPTEPAKKK